MCLLNYFLLPGFSCPGGAATAQHIDVHLVQPESASRGGVASGRCLSPHGTATANARGCSGAPRPVLPNSHCSSCPTRSDGSTSSTSCTLSTFLCRRWPSHALPFSVTPSKLQNFMKFFPQMHTLVTPGFSQTAISPFLFLHLFNNYCSTLKISPLNLLVHLQFIDKTNLKCSTL